MGKDILNRARYSPHSPFGSLLVTGGVDARLRIHDGRNLGSKDSMVWTVEKAHDGPINDVAFNPFIPYWLASAGSFFIIIGKDGAVKVWDLRYLSGHVGRIDGHYNSVESVTLN